jgi:dienelactone hydrolase
MNDLAILEILVAFFLFMPLCRPYVKTLMRIEGFVYFPLLALFCAAALFPAYGFRPECVPLLLFTVLQNILNTRSLFASIGRLRYADDERGPFFFLIMLALLALSSFTAIRYVPLTDTSRMENARTLREYDAERGTEYFLRVYENPAAFSKGPFILAVPPICGSAAIIDKVAAALAARGARVVSFSRKGFDLGALDTEGKLLLPEYGVVKKLFSALSGGWKKEKQNEAGRFLETERADDIAFMLRYLEKNLSPSEVLVLGYGAGGSAIAALAADERFIQKFPFVSGAAAVESSLLSFYQPQTPPHAEEKPAARGGSFFEKKWDGFKNWSGRFKNAPVAFHAPPRRLYFPLAFIMSDALWGADERYAPVKAFVEEDGARVTLYTPPGTGAADFTDVPEKFPLLSALLRGEGRRVWTEYDSVSQSARLILDFAAGLESPKGTGDSEQ